MKRLENEADATTLGHAGPSGPRPRPAVPAQGSLTRCSLSSALPPEVRLPQQPRSPYIHFHPSFGTFLKLIITTFFFFMEKRQKLLKNYLTPYP